MNVTVVWFWHFSHKTPALQHGRKFHIVSGKDALVVQKLSANWVAVRLHIIIQPANAARHWEAALHKQSLTSTNEICKRYALQGDVLTIQIKPKYRTKSSMMTCCFQGLGTVCTVPGKISLDNQKSNSSIR